jgi:hypothetical protein
VKNATTKLEDCPTWCAAGRNGEMENHLSSDRFHDSYTTHITGKVFVEARQYPMPPHGRDVIVVAVHDVVVLELAPGDARTLAAALVGLADGLLALPEMSR